MPAQQKEWVFFTDKGPDIACQLAQPLELLSEEALSRRQALGIEISETDLPVFQGYLLALSKHSPRILSTSKWLNAAVVVADESEMAAIKALPFVMNTQAVRKLVPASVVAAPATELAANENANVIGNHGFEYGRASHQNEMINIPAYHDKGFTGKGVRIAIFDGGFMGGDTIAVFDSLRIRGQVLRTYDFVENQEDVYHSHPHGTQVLSTIAANLPGKMVGTAPDANFMLCRTEDTRSETEQEEYNWLRAVEWVDSLGIDIIHSSLGYTNFDDPKTSHKYSDLDGNTAVITKAADLAASKGILVTTSAGNEGGGAWRYIAAPCDADSALCIGAVDKYTKLSFFSSVGPTADGRTKPDVVAMGTRTTVAHPNNKIYGGNGTSYSAPIMAGFVACLLQAHPDKPMMEIIRATRLSADQAGLPDNNYGYGIPDAIKADSLLKAVRYLAALKVEMTEKPLRGRKPKPSPPQKVDPPVKASAPEVAVEMDFDNYTKAETGKILKITAAKSATIKKVVVYQGKKKITFDPDDLIIEGSVLTLNTEYLMKGKYEIKLVANKFKERVPFSVE